MARTTGSLDGFILLPTGGYFYGVEAGTAGRKNTELHGGFKTYAEAHEYMVGLLAEYSDYTYAQVVKIEIPAASRP